MEDYDAIVVGAGPGVRLAALSWRSGGSRSSCWTRASSSSSTGTSSPDPSTRPSSPSRARNGDFCAPIVASNAGIQPTVLKLVGSEHFDKAYVNRVRDLVPSVGFAGVRHFLSEPVLDRQSYMYCVNVPRMARQYFATHRA